MPDPLVDIGVSLDNVEPGELTVVSLRGREAISEMFHFDVDVVPPDQRLPEAVAVGERMSLTLSVGGEQVRQIHGVVVSIEAIVDTAATRPVYRLRLAPRGALAALVCANMVFVDVTPIDVLRLKLPLMGYDERNQAMRIFDNYAQRELIVQYDETDLTFFSRLSEQHGISFWFEHQAERETLVLGDKMEGFPLLPGVEPLQARRNESDERPGLLSLRLTTRLLPRMVLLDDYNYNMPQLELFSQARVSGGTAGGVVEYGVNYATPPEGARLATAKAQELSCREHIYQGTSSVLALSAGYTVALAEHAVCAADELLLTEVEHEVTLHQPGQSDQRQAYRNSFTAVSCSTPFRPARKTPRPRVSGVITGFIERGPHGEMGGSSRLDEHGRYLVEMHFSSLLTPLGARPSRYMRMAHPYGGANQGMHFPLRPGTEVLVAFVNGDPDRPVIVGAVHNGLTPSPVTSREATTNRLLTNSGVMLEIWERR